MILDNGGIGEEEHALRLAGILLRFVDESEKHFWRCGGILSLTRLTLGAERSVWRNPNKSQPTPAPIDAFSVLMRFESDLHTTPPTGLSIIFHLLDMC